MTTPPSSRRSRPRTSAHARTPSMPMSPLARELSPDSRTRSADADHRWPSISTASAPASGSSNVHRRTVRPGATCGRPSKRPRCGRHAPRPSSPPVLDVRRSSPRGPVGWGDALTAAYVLGLESPDEMNDLVQLLRLEAPVLEVEAADMESIVPGPAERSTRPPTEWRTPPLTHDDL